MLVLLQGPFVECHCPFYLDVSPHAPIQPFMASLAASYLPCLQCFSLLYVLKTTMAMGSRKRNNHNHFFDRLNWRFSRRKRTWTSWTGQWSRSR